MRYFLAIIVLIASSTFAFAISKNKPNTPQTQPKWDFSDSSRPIKCLKDRETLVEYIKWLGAAPVFGGVASGTKRGWMIFGIVDSEKNKRMIIVEQHPNGSYCFITDGTVTMPQIQQGNSNMQHKNGNRIDPKLGIEHKHWNDT